MAGGPLVMVSNAVFCNSQFSQRNEMTCNLMLLLAFAKKWEIISGGEAKRRISLLRGQVYFTFYKLHEQFAIYSLQSWISSWIRLAQESQ